MNIVRLYETLNFRGHLCLVFELLSINIYEFLKIDNFEGVSLSLMRKFAIQILYSLNYMKEMQIIHCDLKPENINLKEKNKSGIKVIDFGSSCFRSKRIYTYIQSRFYRAPEIILGLPYDHGIDMWSFGCILAELYTGYPLFPGENEFEQLSFMIEVLGIPSDQLLKRGNRSTEFFEFEPLLFKYLVSDKLKEYFRIESSVDHNLTVIDEKKFCKSRSLREALELEGNDSFLDFLEKCLKLDPKERLTPEEALIHPWIIDGFPK